MDNEEIFRRLDDAQKTLGCLAKRNIELRQVADMLAEELETLCAHIPEVYWEEPGEKSSALIAYRNLEK